MSTITGRARIGSPLYSANSSGFGVLPPVMTASPTATKRIPSGTAAIAYQRSETRQRTSRAPKSRSPVPPRVLTVTMAAATSGPNKPG